MRAPSNTATILIALATLAVTAAVAIDSLPEKRFRRLPPGRHVTVEVHLPELPEKYQYTSEWRKLVEGETGLIASGEIVKRSPGRCFVLEETGN